VKPQQNKNDAPQLPAKPDSGLIQEFIGVLLYHLQLKNGSFGSTLTT